MSRFTRKKKSEPRRKTTAVSVEKLLWTPICVKSFFSAFFSIRLVFHRFPAEDVGGTSESLIHRMAAGRSSPVREQIHQRACEAAHPGADYQPVSAAQWPGCRRWWDPRPAANTCRGLERKTTGKRTSSSRSGWPGCESDEKTPIIIISSLKLIARFSVHRLSLVKFSLAILDISVYQAAMDQSIILLYVFVFYICSFRYVQNIKTVCSKRHGEITVGYSSLSGPDHNLSIIMDKIDKTVLVPMAKLYLYFQPGLWLCFCVFFCIRE